MIDYDKLIDVYLKYPDRGDFAPIADGDKVCILYTGNVGLGKARHLVFSTGAKASFREVERQEILAELERLEASRDDEFEGDIGDFEDVSDILSASYDDAPIIKLVNQTIIQAAKNGASDIHFEGLTGKFAVRFRIDGKLHTVKQYPKSLQESIIARIKVVSDLDVAETRKAQDGRINLRIGNRDVDIRVSTVPSVTGEKAVLRILEKSKSLVTIDKTGLPENLVPRFRKAIKRPNGIILVTGPTGSGKTTTLYAALQELVSDDTNIMTIEDPVEYQMEKITQVQVNRTVDITFASAVRAFLRQDPDIILIGEIRDTETAQAAIQASLTGHLVLSTLHTNNAPTAVARLIDMDVEPFLLSSSIVAVLGQRLVRKLCPHCRKEVSAEQYVKDFFMIEGLEIEKYYEPVGCDRCLHTGFSGRLGVFEMLTITDGIRKLINERADSSAIAKEARNAGYKPMMCHGYEMVSSGITSPNEIIAVSGND
ncbi:type II secretion system protein E [Denitrovibrio acetiphilus DSM 12809]|uniref:Type II secretion system protein E n=1 Tax=Denitrovibrio acetiphilus (strain DSM 12809 / NBRC 114555 / N2460) TaxID=522772 RepID=D4H3X8_DENA2|nr:GspE/PulE family protein [Denitrovibrio acetiphilus]ADD67289.1 type II secretion system protein E [Denitrovibrio acetiphilus DSM 12809]